MLLELIKKDLLLFARNKHTLIVLLLMPIALISILGFSLSSFMDGDVAAINAKVYMVNHGSEQDDLKLFLKELEKTGSIPEQAKQRMAEAAEQSMPVSLLRDNVLGSKELRDTVILKEGKPEEIPEIKNDDEVVAIIEIPEHFTLQFLRQMFLEGDGALPSLTVSYNEGKELSAEVIGSILEDFQRQYSFSNLLKEEQLSVSITQQSYAVEIEKKTVDQVPSVNAISYYTAAMITMFALYCASNQSSFALAEKKALVFNRLLISNVPRLVYLSSSFLTGILLVSIQVPILYGTVALLYGVPVPDLLDFLVITLFLGASVGGIAALLTAMTHRIKKENVADLTNTTVFTFMAFLGGSFIPLSNFGGWMQGIGNLLPNGAALNAYVKMMQGYGLSSSLPQLGSMAVYSILLFAVAAVIFPKKGDA